MQRCTLKYIPAEGTAGAEVLRWEPFSSGLAEAEGQRKERLQSDHIGSWKSLLQSGYNQKLVETFDRGGGWGVTWRVFLSQRPLWLLSGEHSTPIPVGQEWGVPAGVQD